MSVKRVKDIKPADDPEPIEVRVIKIWIPYSSNQEKKNDLWYLLVDIHGDAIEATADIKFEDYFKSLIQLQKCYRINEYVCMSAKTHMPLVPHSTTLKIGKKATCELLDNTKIPSFYYNFASLDDLPNRRTSPKMLTDYIGRVEHVTPILIRKGRRLRKVTVRGERKGSILITLWGDKADLIQPHEAQGKALAVTATAVNVWDHKLQLDSTVPTTVELNPNIPELQSYLDRFNSFGDILEVNNKLEQITIMELQQKKQNNNLQQERYICNATITEIQEHRGWFYVHCPDCPKKCHPQNNTFVCEDHKMSTEPMFMYCMNTIVADNTGSCEAAFFNDALYDILKISCRDMVIEKENKDQKHLPEEIKSIIGLTLTLTINVKKEGSIGVDGAQKAMKITPATPDPKGNAIKRPTTSTSGNDKTKKVKGH